VPTDDVGIANTEQSGSVSKSSDNPNLGISQGIDNTDTGSITKDTNDDTIPISPPISLPKDGAFNNFFKSKVALAEEKNDVDKNPCEKLKDDQKAAEDMAEDEEEKYSEEEQENAKRDADTIKKAIGRCCLSLPGGGGIGGGKGGDVTPPIDITPPVGPNPPDNPEDPNLPPENPDPILPPVIDRYVCDFSSAGYNNLYNCVVKSGPIVPGELICNINNNLTVPVTQDITKHIL